MTIEELAHEVDVLRAVLRDTMEIRTKSADRAMDLRIQRAFARIGALERQVAWRFIATGEFFRFAARRQVAADLLPMEFMKKMASADSQASSPPAREEEDED